MFRTVFIALSIAAALAGCAPMGSNYGLSPDRLGSGCSISVELIPIDVPGRSYGGGQIYCDDGSFGTFRAIFDGLTGRFAGRYEGTISLPELEPWRAAALIIHANADGTLPDNLVCAGDDVLVICA